MDFLIELVKTSANFILLVAVAGLGIFLGKKARDRKDKSSN